MHRESNTLRFDQRTYNLVCVCTRVCALRIVVTVPDVLLPSSGKGS